MSNCMTGGILKEDWTIVEYIQQFVNIQEKRSFLITVDHKLISLKTDYEDEFKKSNAEYLEYFNKTLGREFAIEEFKRKKKNFPKRISEWKIHIDRTNSDLSKYTSMIKEVVNLGLIENKVLKESMLSEIKSAIESDCKFSSKPVVDGEYQVDDLISWWLSELWRVKKLDLVRYNNERAELLRQKYQAQELIEVFSKLNIRSW